MNNDDLPYIVKAAVKVVQLFFAVRGRVENVPRSTAVLGHDILSPALLQNGALPSPWSQLDVEAQLIQPALKQGDRQSVVNLDETSGTHWVRERHET